MKKVTALTLSLVMVVASLFVPSLALSVFAADNFPGPLTVVKATTAPTIDGTISADEWSASDKNIISTAATINSGIGDAWAPETSNAVANLYFLWDDNGLYFAADVADDTFAPSLAEGTALNSTDGIQLGFDPAGNASDALSGGYFFSFIPGSNVDAKGPALSYEHFVYGDGAGANVADKGVIVKGVRNINNYILEGFIPWSAINAKDEGFNPVIGKNIPFGICMMDYSAEGKVLSLTKSFIGWGTIGYNALTLASANTSVNNESTSTEVSSTDTSNTEDSSAGSNPKTSDPLAVNSVLYMAAGLVSLAGIAGIGLTRKKTK